MIIVQKLSSEFPQRIAEWGIAYIMVSWGALLIAAGDQLSPFQAVFYSGWVRLMPLRDWGLAACMIGVIRIAALYVNGAHRRSPVVRMATGAASMFIWMLALGAVLHVGTLPTAAFYFWCIVGDGYGVYIASGDAYLSRRKGAAQGDRSRVY